MLEVYPIGKAQLPASLDEAVVREAITAIARLPDELRRSVDVGPSLDLVAALHSRWVDLLESLGTAEMERPWRMPGGEPRPLWRLPVVYAWHGRHHAAQIERARAHFGS